MHSGAARTARLFSRGWSIVCGGGKRLQGRIVGLRSALCVSLDPAEV